MSASIRWHAADDAGTLAHQACARILGAAQAAIAERGQFSIVLAGGTTPGAAYGLLRSACADWSRWQVYFGDERCLSANNPQRNSHMAHSLWLAHVALPPENVHAIPAEMGAAAGAAAYAQRLKGVAEFDCVLLGLGEDGHTASLFPGHDLGAVRGGDDVLAVHSAPKPPPERVSLSAARLAHARQVLFLVAGQGKRSAVTAWRSGAAIPAAAIQPQVGVDILVERALLT